MTKRIFGWVLASALSMVGCTSGEPGEGQLAARIFLKDLGACAGLELTVSSDKRDAETFTTGPEGFVELGTWTDQRHELLFAAPGYLPLVRDTRLQANLVNDMGIIVMKPETVPVSGKISMSDGGSARGANIVIGGNAVGSDGTSLDCDATLTINNGVTTTSVQTADEFTLPATADDDGNFLTRVPRRSRGITARGSHTGYADRQTQVSSAVLSAATDALPATIDNLVLDPLTGFMNIVDGAYTASTTVTVQLSAFNGVNEMAVGERIGLECLAGDWVTYAAVTSVAISGDDGAKTVCASVRNTFGQTVNGIEAGILLDTTLPSVAISAAAKSATSVVVLSLGGFDGGSGIDSLALADTAAGLTGAVRVPFEPTKIFDLGWPGSGSHAPRAVWAQAFDRAGNAAIPVSTAVLVDTAAPSGGISYAASVTWDTVATLLLTYDNDAHLMKLSPGAVCAGGTWTSVAGQVEWPVSLLGSSQTTSVRYQDSVGNQGACYSTTITVDATGPVDDLTADFWIDQGLLTADPDISLTLSATGADQMRIGQGTTCSGTWQAYASTAPFTLTGSDGTQTIAVQFRDVDGTTTGCLTRSIDLDTTAPGFAASVTGVESIPGRTAQQLVWVSLSGVDSDAAEMKVSNVPGLVGASWQSVDTYFQWSLVNIDGIQNVYLTLRDAAGNESPVTSTSIELDTTPPSDPALQVIDIDDPADGFAFSSSDVELAWNTPVAPDLAGFELERFVQGVDPDFLNIAAFGPAVAQYRDPVSATVGRSHNYRIRAFDDLGNKSAWSIVATALPVEPMDVVSWATGVDNDLMIGWRPGPGIFSLSGLYQFTDYGGSTFDDPLVSNAVSYLRTSPAAQRLNEQVEIRENNQDSSLVYESSHRIPLDERELIEIVGDQSIDPSVAVDMHGNAHLAYWSIDTDFLHYATNKSGTWVIEHVDTSQLIDTYVNLDVDAEGFAHIGYERNNDLWYATNRSGDWVLIPVHTDNIPGEYSDLVVDSQGAVHMSYYVRSQNDLYYATNAGGSWSYELIDSSGNAGFRGTAIDVDSQDNPHIAYRNGFGRLGYASNTTGTWDVAAPFTDTVYAQWLGLALDGNDKAHVAAESLGDLIYYNNVTGTWNVTQLFAGVDIDWADIDVDARGAAYIIFGDNDFYEAFFATNVTGDWTYFPVENDPANFWNGYFPSIDVEPNGKAHLTWYDNLNLDVSYASYVTGSRIPTLVDNSGNTGTESDVAVAPDGSVHISYKGNGQTRYATNRSGHWQYETIAGASGSPYDTTIDIDADGNPHVAYNNSGVFYAYKSTDTWQIESLGSGNAPSIALDSVDAAHVAWVNGNNLWYASNTTGLWSSAVIFSHASIYAQGLALALDASNNVHVSVFTSNAGGKLYYATNATGSWSTEIVDDTGRPMQFSGIGVDPDGYVHISYYEDDNTDLSYATNKSGSWVSTVLDADFVGIFNNLVVDPYGGVHIVYQDWNDWDIRYLTNALGGWQMFEIIANKTGGDGEPGIAIAPNGHVHVSVRDVSRLYHYSGFAGVSRRTSSSRVTPF